MSRTKTWKVWAGMRERCINPHARHFNHYGGRGISFCDRWNSFENFLADMGERPTGMSLDRINVNGNYEPGNCRWATSVEQARNKRNSCVLTGFGETKTASEWIHDPRRAASISPGAVRTRITKGWTVESALTIEKIVGRRAPSALITYSKAGAV